MKTPTPLLFVLLTAAAACSSGDDDAPATSPDGAPPDDADPPPDAAVPSPPDAAPPPAFTLTGDVVGDDVPADAEMIVAWVVSSGSDHVYLYGSGTSTGASYSLALADQQPPDLALNQTGGGARFGVAFVALVPTGTDLPEGILDPDTDLEFLGLSPIPLIWRHGTAGGNSRWINAFDEDAYRCGRCVEAGEDETFDHFEPIDCAELDINAPAEELNCNWT